MFRKSLALLVFLFSIAPFGSATADKYDDTIKVFKDAGQSGTFFNSAYGYAVFPTIGKGGLVVGAAAGQGRVYVGGKHVGGATDLFDGMKDSSIQALLEANGVEWNREADRDPYSFLPKWLHKR